MTKMYLVFWTVCHMGYCLKLNKPSFESSCQVMGVKSEYNSESRGSISPSESGCPHCFLPGNRM